MKVFIEAATHSYKKMFQDNGWEVVPTLVSDVDLVCFTGGEDVNPELYGEPKHLQSIVNPHRDEKCQHYWDFAQANEIPCAGVCRGGQFLNVMNGGKMWQHVGGHGLYGTHPAYDELAGEEVPVSSTHHQMMYPHESGKVLLIAVKSTFREFSKPEEKDPYPEMPDIESVFYPGTSSLCFQPHPEHFQKTHPCQELFFKYVGLLF